MEVSVIRGRQGGITNICFVADHGNTEIQEGTVLNQRLRKVVKKRKVSIGQYQAFSFSAIVQSYYPLGAYRTNAFAICPMDDNAFELRFSIEAYDRNQAEGLLLEKTTWLMDFLAVETNTPYWIVNRDDKRLVETMNQRPFKRKNLLMELRYVMVIRLSQERVRSLYTGCLVEDGA